MTESDLAVFLDANVLLYYIDASSPHHQSVVETLTSLIEAGTKLHTSHHALEEVLHVTLSVFGTDAVRGALNDISAIPGLLLIEPAPVFEFAERYTTLLATTNVGLNDCLLLQLMLDNNITHLYTYDQKLAAAATALNISCIPNNTKSPL